MDLFQDGQFRGRADQGRCALDLNPKLSHAYDTRTHIYESLGRKEEAEADFRKALALRPTIETSQHGPKRLGAAP